MNYLQPNVINEMTIKNSENSLVNSIPQVTSSDFKQLLLAKIKMAMRLNSGLNSSGSNTFPSSMANMFPMMLSSQSSSLGSMGQAISAYNSGLHMANISTNRTATPPTDEFNHIINEAAQRYNVDEKLIHAIIRAESNYNPNAKSNAGAAGLMQLMPNTARSLGVTDRYDIRQNIFGGTRYFSKMLMQHGGNLELALASYNAGPGNVKKYGGVPPFKETQNYIQKVMKYYVG